MIVIPAIDLKDHRVVRLKQGRMSDSTIYSDSPLVMAQKWVACGTKRLHLVDLNGAFEGRPVHLAEVAAIRKAIPDLQIEIGGGLRSEESLRAYFDVGVDYCILGTVAVKNPAFLEKASSLFPKKIILGLDAKEGMVATEGWDDVSSLKSTELARRFKDCPLESIIYTDVAKDGMLAGMNFDQIQEMAESSVFPIIASGGFTSLDDIEQLKKMKNILGVIAGKALYEGRVDLTEAIKSCAPSESKRG